MVKYSLYCLLVASLLSGCASGIVDNEPLPAGTAGEYFWPSTLTSAKYERFDTLTGKRQAYDLLFNTDLNGTTVNDQVTSSAQFSYRMSDAGIMVDHIGKNSIIPLPEGFTLVSSDSTDVPTQVAREMKRVVVTGIESIFAIDKDDSLFYSLDSGITWTLCQTWNGGKITSLATSNGGGNTVAIFAGTADGGMYRSTNTGKTWEVILKPIDREITAITVSDTVYFASGERVFRLSNGDTMDISRGWIHGKITHLTTVRNTQNSQWLVAGVEDDGLYRTPLPTDSIYWEKTNSSQRIDKCLGLVTVNAKYLYSLGESNGKVGLYASTDQGMNWITATSEVPSGSTGLVSDAKGKLLVYGPERTTISVYNGSGTDAKLYRSPAIATERVNDVSALNGVFSVATRQGVYYSASSGEVWSNISGTKLTQTGTKRVAQPGGLLILTSNSLTPDSTWIAGQCEGLVLGSMTALRIRATVLSPLTKLDLTSLRSGVYEDVIPVKYTLSTLNNLDLDVHLMIYFAKGIGPVWIRQITGKMAVAEIYRLAD